MPTAVIGGPLDGTTTEIDTKDFDGFYPNPHMSVRYLRKKYVWSMPGGARHADFYVASTLDKEQERAAVFKWAAEVARQDWHAVQAQTPRPTKPYGPQC